MFASVDTTRLAVFRQVVSSGSFTAAAAALGISQPAVSQHIARLEQEIGVALLDRSRQGLRTTYPGKVLLHHADNLMTQLREAARELAALSQPDGGELRMVSFASAASTIVPPVVGAFRLTLPNVGVLLTEFDPPVALPQLMAGEVDLVLAYDYPLIATPRDPRLRWDRIATDRMAAALPAGHQLAATDEVPLAALADEKWIVPHPSQCRDALFAACRRTGFTPAATAASNDYQAIMGLVGADVGITVVPRLVAIGPTPDGVVLRPLGASPLARVVSAVTRTNGYQPPAVEHMVSTLGAMVRELARPGLELD
jgi:DNA-binding transcriptional LysR family regulator